MIYRGRPPPKPIESVWDRRWRRFINHPHVFGFTLGTYTGIVSYCIYNFFLGVP